MAKRDYKDTDLKNEYKALVEDPGSNLDKIIVSSDEKRTRAELLDMLEELFENDELAFNPTFQLRLKAMLHIMVKSIDNTLDDGLGTAVAVNTAKTGITTSQANAITANTAKTGITNSQASAITANTAKVTFPFESGVDGATIAITHSESKGTHSLVFTVTIPSEEEGGKATTKSTTLTLK